MPIDAAALDAYVNEGAPTGEEPMDGEEEGTQEPDKYEKLCLLLQKYAEDVVEASDELDADLVSDLTLPMDADNQAILQEGLGMLDPKLKRELEAVAGGISPGDALTCMNTLVEAEVLDDPQRPAGWLYRVGEMLGGAAPAPEEGEEEMMEDEGMVEEMPAA